MKLFIYIFAAVITLSNTRAIAQRNNNVPPETHPDNRDTTPKKPPKRYVQIDTVKPVPVETHTFVNSTLRMRDIFPNEDALELIALLNPGIYQADSVKSDYKLILPVFPEPSSKIIKPINEAFRNDLRSDDNINNLFSSSARKLDTLANVFAAKDFVLEDDTVNGRYKIIKDYLPALAELTSRATTKIKHTSKKTVSTLDKETAALNKLLSACNGEDTLSKETIYKVYSLMSDMNILLNLITGKKLEILPGSDNSFNNNYSFSYTSFSLKQNAENAEEDISEPYFYDDDDPRKFNIYIFRKSLVETTGKRDPEMHIYTVSYVIPALEDDIDEWTTLPEPASTVHCYFAPARFKFSITDTRTGTVYTAMEDLFDAQKDPDEKWSLINLFNPTYRLIFLIP
jgi:hypothetical protein